MRAWRVGLEERVWRREWNSRRLRIKGVGIVESLSIC